MLTLIVGTARNGAIGRANTIPWDVPEDLKFFAQETSGAALIMGRRTWESLPHRPLRGRLNIVVSSEDVGGVSARSAEDALRTAKAAGHMRIYGMGGHRIYGDLLPHAHRLLISKVDIDVPDADTFFPDIDLSAWNLSDTHLLRRESPACQIHEYLRVAPRPV